MLGENNSGTGGMNCDIPSTSMHSIVHNNPSTSSSSVVAPIGKQWSGPYNGLWQFQQPNFNAEKAYNVMVGRKRPFCAICSLFTTKEGPCEQFEIQPEDAARLPPPMSKPWVTEGCFKSSEAAIAEPPEDVRAVPLIDQATLESPLLTCSVCLVTVHASCYGVFEQLPQWTCARCRAPDRDTAECFACFLRGGALKRTICGRWIHMVCAIALPVVQFQNIIARDGILVLGAALARKKEKCAVCRNASDGVKKPGDFPHGLCVRCVVATCEERYHVTCARASCPTPRVETRDMPHATAFTCDVHIEPPIFQRRNPPVDGAVAHISKGMYDAHTQAAYAANRALPDPPVEVGEKVIAKHPNNNYYRGVVTHRQPKTYYAIEFEADGSWSENTRPQDVVNINCLAEGSPPLGTMVDVRWSDNNVWRAIFRGENIQDIYTIKFNDGCEIKTKRDRFWTLTADLPRRVKAKLTEGGVPMNTLYDQPATTTRTGRQVKPNPKYFADYTKA